MIVKRGDDSSTWNQTANAWNEARRHWLALIHALELEALLDEMCPGKVLRLMAADVAAWHFSAGGSLSPDTSVWNELPLPWEVLSGRKRCTRAMIEASCLAHGMDPEASGWTMARETQVVEFRATPELVHGVSVENPHLAQFMKKAGFFSGKKRQRPQHALTKVEAASLHHEVMQEHRERLEQPLGDLEDEA